MYKYAIDLVTIDDVQVFTDMVKEVESPVVLTGKDENGHPWTISGKSLLCSLILPANIQNNRAHTAHDVDWNTVWCECEEDIYSKISQFVK